MTRPSNRARPNRKTRDAALLLPVLGVLLLVSPMLAVFTGEGTVFGIPSPFIYVFGVWAGLILLARALAVRLHATRGDAD